jgi:MoxR-like ATPase
LQIAVNAGHRTRESLLADLSTFRLAGSHNNRQALAAIAEESQLALSDINDRVSGVCLMRQRRVEAIRDAMSRSRYVEIRGEAGVGKSGVLRRLAEDLSAEAQVCIC